MAQTVIGVFDSYNDAQQVAQELIGMGIDRTHVRISQQNGTGGKPVEDKGFWESLKDAFGFGDDDSYGYREAARRGGTVVSVTTQDAHVDRVVDIMQRHNAINLDERVKQWQSEGWSGRQQVTATAGQATAAASRQTAAPQAQGRRVEGGEAIPVIEEELEVGKRAVSRGAVRIHSRITEKPVQEQVQLREEHVNVERRPVDRPLTAADANAAFQERTIEATEMAEQAVVAKSARVVEEVVVNKDVQQRTETVRDTVRRTDVEVERTNDERFRPAYEFADELSTDTRYRGRTWDTIETDARRSFEQRHPNSKWDEFRDAIRTRYDRSRTNA